MPTVMKEVDIVFVGFGFGSSMVAKELVGTGLKMVGLERGFPRFTSPDFQSPEIHDELRFAVRKAMMQDNVRETITLRHSTGETALPVRRWGAFLPGTNLGGSGVHWNGQHFRFQEKDFLLKTAMEERYGKKFVDALDLTIQDWGVTYQELEPYYDKFEYLCGTSGKAGNIKGQIQPGGNPFEAPRSREYPTPPLKEQYNGALFRKAATELGYHPYPQPASNLSVAYTNPDGLKLNACVYCGYCERFACEHYAKASPQTISLPILLRSPNFELRTQCQVVQVNRDSTGKKATGVTYYDAAGREVFQPASLVVISMFPINNVRMLLLSKIGKPYDPQTGTGVVGRNYSYQTIANVWSYFEEDVNINPFMGSGAIGTMIDDFGGDNFDHGPYGFIGGSYILAAWTGGRPIEQLHVPPDAPSWGKGWKDAAIKHYNHTGQVLIHGTSMSTRGNYVDLDPTYRDAWGLPLLRMTFDFPENDVRMIRFCTDRALEIGKAMPGSRGVSSKIYGKRPFDVAIYQSTHNAGGAIMGTDPSTSVVNKYLQSWDVPNLFVLGASAFPQNGTYNYTGTLMALNLFSADAIRNRYLKDPGPLV
jgi:gluconate 2-dehydrogenase alpha chain